ncbi:hypothetical protein [Burkholderia cepacia]|uniref:hypothetical protein n=1 Tax=Burkholderia cepacia TaxID=292 RepID=UPI0018C8C9E7|nr:hypothetical protein [Burkholderia cepacia]
MVSSIQIDINDSAMTGNCNHCYHRQQRKEDGGRRQRTATNRMTPFGMRRSPDTSNCCLKGKPDRNGGKDGRSAIHG